MHLYKEQTSWTTKEPNPFKTLGQIPSFLVVAAITVYQWTISPDHGIVSLYTIGVCKHRPTCSEFTKQAVKSEGVIKGLKKGFTQIKKCY